MQELTKGQYYGQHREELSLGMITLTDTQYTHRYVDWHYHENAYFTYLIRGELFEANKKTAYELKQGDLLFHHWQDAHFNRIKEKYTQGFHIEIEPEWFQKFQLNTSAVSGSTHLFDPLVKQELAQIYIESKLKDSCLGLAVESHLLSIFSRLEKIKITECKRLPGWVKRLRERLHDPNFEPGTLKDLSHELDIHPVHLSRTFKKYFHTNLGEYLRMIRLNQALKILKKGESPGTSIAYECGFSDQSHFIRLFKRQFGMTPGEYQKRILHRC